MKPPFIKRVAIKNYKSIAHCDVELGALQFLVGRNGAGKSNFLDALMFIRDALVYNNFNSAPGRFISDQAINRKADSDGTVSMELDINLDNDTAGFLSFELGSEENYIQIEEFKVIKEKCVIRKNGNFINGYQTLNGEIQTDKDKRQFPPVADDRLYLHSMTNFLEFEMLYDALSSIQIYNDNYFRGLSDSTVRSGIFPISNNSIPQILSSISPNVRERIIEYLQDIVPSFLDIKETRLEKLWILSFLMKDVGEFYPGNISNGTFRALSILTLALQESEGDTNNFPALLCIEEPEMALHARAMAGILSALEEASEKRQVLVTTHSTEMLDNKEITADRILPVELRDSETVIGPLESVSKKC